MKTNLSYCGIICSGCPVYWATQKKDETQKERMRQSIARLCNEQYQLKLKSTDIVDCDGCKTVNGRLFPGCLDCEVRNCAREKGIENCAQCDIYPCDALKKLFKNDPMAQNRLDVLRDCRPE